jgi:hypothetical protein
MRYGSYHLPDRTISAEPHVVGPPGSPSVSTGLQPTHGWVGWSRKGSPNWFQEEGNAGFLWCRKENPRHRLSTGGEEISPARGMCYGSLKGTEVPRIADERHSKVLRFASGSCGTDEREYNMAHQIVAHGRGWKKMPSSAPSLGYERNLKVGTRKVVQNRWRRGGRGLSFFHRCGEMR